MLKFSKKTTKLWQNFLLYLKCKVQVFREDHKNLVKSSSWHFLEDIESRWNIYQIFAAFLKIWTLFSKQWINWEVSPIFCDLLRKLYLVNVKSTGRFRQINMLYPQTRVLSLKDSSVWLKNWVAVTRVFILLN